MLHMVTSHWISYGRKWIRVINLDAIPYDLNVPRIDQLIYS